MTATLTWTDAAGAEVVLTFDGTKSQVYEHPAEVTEHPVEQGPAVTDHIRPGNPTAIIEGLITNAPVAIPATQAPGVLLATQVVTLATGAKVSLQRWSSAFDRVKACDELLRGLMDTATLVRLTTSLRSTDGLAITRCKVERPDSGDAIAVTLEMKRVRVVSTSRAPVPAVRRAQVATQRAAQPVDDRGVIARALDGGAPVTQERAAAREAYRRRAGL